MLFRSCLRLFKLYKVFLLFAEDGSNFPMINLTNATTIDGDYNWTLNDMKTGNFRDNLNIPKNIQVRAAKRSLIDMWREGKYIVFV